MAKTTLTWVDTEAFNDLLQAACDVVKVANDTHNWHPEELYQRILEFKPEFSLDEETKSVIQ